jgi:hypothetical protein
MNNAGEIRSERIRWGVLGLALLVFCIYVYEDFFAGGTATPVPTQTTAEVGAPAGSSPNGSAEVSDAPAAKKVAISSARLDPTLHMDAMLVSEAVVYSGTGRNIFSQNSAPAIAIPKAIASARPLPMGPYVAPQPTGPPPPPPIDLKFFGTEEAMGSGTRVALLLHGDSVFTARAGDVVARRYKVIAVDAKSIQVEDMQNNNRQTLPLLVN